MADGVTHGDDGDVFCYSEACVCRLPHKLWPFGMTGDDNVFDQFKPRVGRVVAGKFIAAQITEDCHG